MAEPYRFVQSEATIKTVGQEIVEPAERWTFEAPAQQIVYSLVFAPIPPPQGGASIWTPEAINYEAQLWADKLTALKQITGVTGIGQAQEIDDLNNLHELMLVTIRSAGGLASRTLSFPFHLALDNTARDLITAAVAELNAAVAGG